MIVAFIGNIAGGAVMMERAVHEAGIETKILLPRKARVIESVEHFGFSPSDFSIIKYSVISRKKTYLSRLFARIFEEIDALRTLFLVRKVDCVQGFTGALFNYWVWWVAFGVLKWKPYIACATGSDIREVAALDEGKAGAVMREFFAEARVTLLLNLDMVAVANKLGLVNARFFPFSVNTDYFSPLDGSLDCSEERSNSGRREVRFFMPSHLDWGVCDPGESRSSTKGNDRFIRAFSRYIKAGARAKLILLDRGPDRFEARRLIDELGIGESVEFYPQLNRQELRDKMREADVIVDQFDVGAFGTTGLEGMAVGKPVMIYIDSVSAGHCYPEQPPVVNVRTEQEILHQLNRLSDASTRRELGKNARDWVVRFHSEKVVAEKLIEIYEEISAR